MRIINFQEEEYLTRTIDCPSFGTVEVSTVALGDKLVIAMEEAHCTKAADIDEQLFFYVGEDVIFYSDDLLISYLESEVLT